ncbi:MAG TPA: nicotinate phosphoribosyltransferase [Chthoniobacteraceae bacterium]|jgi:nicotinate phosphoribosyltransferase|nr:nicotinate phosphoribosyltransferase [Chthoniobacteraceae bacterium]
MNAPTAGRRCCALLTDLYQLTMAYGYWKAGLEERAAVFHLFFRKQPFGGGFSIACGLADAIEYLRTFAFDEEELAYLGGLTGNDGGPLFEPAFLEYLRRMEWKWTVDAIPEGTVVFPHEPLLRVTGPLIQCQLVETTLLNLLNFQTLIATKAARVCLAAQDDAVLEFGLRRAQGVDGALAASRAAYIGGCTATSNVLAGQLFGIPVRGTHAHSWVMSFDTEEEAFLAYAEAMPNNSVFLVDTYDTLRGVEHAIAMGRRLRERGHELGGVRLDSGDLAYLSQEARRMLDAAGFAKATIVASNDLDEQTIASLKQQGAAINVWGVGTRLVTAYDQPALGGVYKLAAVRDDGGPWQHRIKLSEQTAKISTPGVQQVRRFRHRGLFIGDQIRDLDAARGEERVLVDPKDPLRRKVIPADAEGEDLLVPVFRDGALVYEEPSLTATRERVKTQLAGFHEGHKRFLHPHEYPVGLAPELLELRTRLILKARERGKQPGG